MTRPAILDADLHAYVDGQLAGRELDDVRRYLAAEPAAAVRIGRWIDQRSALKAQLDRIAEEPLPLRLRLSRIATAPDERRSEQNHFLFALGALTGFAFGLAIAGAMLLTLK
ncbi:hypothetical protein [Terrarubrum flagellatum]|uniref:anti-sigma factor family protein n=1 Tax=Terrirubrum flagellatum TaxID=2895980 RepID=UPI003145373E